MPTNPHAKPITPKRWRLRGTASDGLTVTLGRYETSEEAQADAGRLAAGGSYRDLEVQALEVPPELETPPPNNGGVTGA
jgi:hypothetical protein